jgi:hypothetical protein
MESGFYVTETITQGLKLADAKHKKAQQIGMIAFGLQLLNNVVNGSPNEPVVPPILQGFLRGSGSVFFEKQLIAKADKFGYSQTNADVKPNESYNGKQNEITIGFNAPYAAKLHEGIMGTDWIPGEGSKLSKDVGDHFLRKHLIADKEELYQLYADIHRKEWHN